jgi:hypothetical protein
MRQWHPMLLLAALAAGACDFDPSTSPNSPDPIGPNPTRAVVQTVTAARQTRVS